MTNPTPNTGASLTPNVRVEDPKARKIVGNVLGWATVVLFVFNIVDTNIAELDLTWFTVPANGIIAGLLALWQLIVTSPNVPAA